jgi:Skp family chaperone for outer membrane proteins
MKKVGIFAAVLCGIMAGWWGLQTSEAQESVGKSSLTIGVVDVGKVLSQCQANMDREKKTEKRSLEIQEKLKELEAQIKSLGQELQTALKPGSAEHQKQMQEWFNKQALLEAYEKGQREVLGAEVQAWVESLYDTMLVEIGNVARSSNLNLILYKEDTQVKPQKLSELYKMIQSKKVLYSSPTLDVTAEVIEKMDQSFKKNK